MCGANPPNRDDPFRPNQTETFGDPHEPEATEEPGRSVASAMWRLMVVVVREHPAVARVKGDRISVEAVGQPDT